MPIEVRCKSCQHRFRILDKYAGKNVKCPNCEVALAIPVADNQTAPHVPPTTVHGWYLKQANGIEYGPIDENKLGSMITAGSIDSNCQLRREDWGQWQWAADVYPQLLPSSKIEQPYSTTPNTPHNVPSSGPQVPPTKFCFACGESIDARAEICPKCGVRQVAPLGTAAPSDPAVRQASGNKVSAGICGILLGALGVHKFILGLTTPGIIMLLVSLLTFGLGAIPMGLIGLVEGIIYLSKSDEDFYQTYVVEQKGWF